MAHLTPFIPKKGASPRERLYYLNCKRAAMLIRYNTGTLPFIAASRSLKSTPL